MTPKSLADRIEGLIISANESFAGRISSVQNKLYDDLVLIFKNVETNSEGYILQSGSNRKILSEAVFKIDEAFIENTPYVNSLNQYLATIPKIDSLNAAYFETISSGFTPNKIFIRSLQKQTISSIERGLLNEGIESQIKGPLVDILNQNINIGGSFNGMLKQVQDYVKGTDKVDGRLLSYAKNITKDTLAIYARSYQQSISSDLGLVWFLYSGGLIDKSREFCIERSERYFHESEIKSWASLYWTGKMKGTTESSIFIYCGGWSCGHQLIPVHVSVVPKEDLNRISA